jgi:hypothetical protein
VIFAADEMDPGFATSTEVAALGGRARLRAGASLRARQPMTEDLIRQVAEIARANPYEPRKQVALQLYTSQRTASRWLAEARRRGVLEEEK